MEIPQHVIDKWQSIWRDVCGMAYFSLGTVSKIIISKEDSEILKYSNASNFEELTLEYTWKKVSNTRDENRDFIEPSVVPEFEEIYVPRALFETSGVYQWFKFSFPNCKILFWEDDM